MHRNAFQNYQGQDSGPAQDVAGKTIQMMAFVRRVKENSFFKDGMSLTSPCFRSCFLFFRHTVLKCS